VVRARRPQLDPEVERLLAAAGQAHLDVPALRTGLEGQAIVELGGGGGTGDEQRGRAQDERRRLHGGSGFGWSTTPYRRRAAGPVSAG